MITPHRLCLVPTIRYGILYLLSCSLGNQSRNDILAISFSPQAQPIPPFPSPLPSVDEPWALPGRRLIGCDSPMTFPPSSLPQARPWRLIGVRVASCALVQLTLLYTSYTIAAAALEDLFFPLSLSVSGFQGMKWKKRKPFVAHADRYLVPPCMR